MFATARPELGQHPWRVLWNAPELPESVRNATATRFLWLLVFMTLAYSVFGGILLVILEPRSWTRFAGFSLGMIGAGLGGWLGWSGRPWAGLNVACGSIIVGLAYALIHNGGSDAPAFFACVPFVTSLVFAYGPRAALAFIVACLAWVGFAEWAAARELVGPPPPIGPGVRLLMGGFNLLWALSASTLPYLIFRRALGDVAEGESRFAILSHAAFEAIVITDLGVILDANDPFAELVGFSREELFGMRATLTVAPEFRAAVEERFRAGSGSVFEHRLQRKDGTTVTVEARARLLPYKGRLVRVTAIRDLTERKNVEAALEKNRALLAEANTELERKVADRTAALEASNRELEAFAYSVSHDLRSPLRALDAFAHALGEDYGGVLPPRGLDYLERIRAATQRMGELIDCLLDLSRITRAELRREDVDLSALAASVGAELARANAGRVVELVIEPGLRARADPRLLGVVLTNLLANAWKFTSKTAAARVAVGSARDARGVLSFYVKDNGVGFDPRHASRLFGAFQRLHAARDYPGTGVGLATVQRAVQRHGGRVWAQSSPGAGATFFFTLEARPETQETPRS
jgi:PAS domain S-box-containing protein